MAKIGYIMVTSQYDKQEEDRKWMNDFGCVQIIEEEDANEKQRPQWKQLMLALEREKTVINLYNAGHPIEDIWKASGFRSRSSVFRILNQHGIELNRGKHSGPIKKWSERKNPIIVNKNEEQ